MAIIQNKPNMNYGLWGSNGNIAVPTSEKVDLGWIIEKPPNEVMNWLQNRQDSMLQFINQRGIPTWDALTEYPKDSYTVRNGILYKAVSQNIDKDPTLNSAIWSISFATYIDYSNLYDDVQKIKNEDGYLEGYVSKINPVMIGQAKGVGYKDSTGESGLSFSGTKPELINNNVVVAEFSGGSNPKDVVTHEQLSNLLQIYKIGDLYLTTNNTNPKNALGYGTWERYAQGSAVVGFSETPSSPEWTRIPLNQYGQQQVTLTTDNIPKHTHDFPADDQLILSFDLTRSTGFQRSGYDAESTTSSQYSSGWAKTSSSGENLPFSVIQPSIVIFVWRRTG